MICEALLISVDEFIEGEVCLEFSGIRLVCFAIDCPYAIEKGNTYRVELMPYIFDTYTLIELDEIEKESIQRLGMDFSYLVKGKLLGDTVVSQNIYFEDDFLENEYKYLDGKMVAFRIDRLDVAFK